MRKIILWILDKLPGCMYEITGKKWICPKYWIVEKMGAKRFWRKVGWIMCAKEIRGRLDDGRRVQGAAKVVRRGGEKTVRSYGNSRLQSDSGEDSP